MQNKFRICKNRRLVQIRNFLGVVEITKSALFEKMQGVGGSLWPSEKAPNLGFYFRFRFPTSHFFVSTDVHPEVEAQNKGMRPSNDAASYDENEAAAICLLFSSTGRTSTDAKTGPIRKWNVRQAPKFSVFLGHPKIPMRTLYLSRVNWFCGFRRWTETSNWKYTSRFANSKSDYANLFKYPMIGTNIHLTKRIPWLWLTRDPSFLSVMLSFCQQILTGVRWNTICR